MARPTKAMQQARRAEAERATPSAFARAPERRPAWSEAIEPQSTDEPPFDPSLPFDPLLTIDEVARWLGKSPSALHQWRRRGQGPRSILLGATLRYDRADVYAWLAAQKRAQRASA